ncbi:MAG: MATE family efflux transporter [Deltaproteobacteria bacterium]|nr:MATE family efflux transporter [Deltaproteobacteria bacterium]
MLEIGDPQKSKSIPIEKLTKADLPKTVIHLAWPVVLETTFFGLGGIINTILVGRLGASALAAVGLGQQMEFMILVSFAAVTVGATAVISRHVGAKELKEANQALGQALMLALILGLFFSLLLWIFAGQAMKLLRGRPDVIKLGTQYLRAVAFSFTPSFIVATGASSFRGAGNTRTPMIVIGAVTICNIFLGYLLIYGGLGFPSLGVLGAGVAASVSRLLGAVTIIVVLIRGRGLLRYRLPSSWPIDRAMIRRIFRIGLPAGLEQIQFQLAMIFYTVILSSLGTMVYAAHSIAMRIENLAFMPGMGFGMAAMALVGQSLGAGRPELGERAAHLARKYAIILMTLVGAFMFFFGQGMASLFIADLQVIALSALGLKIWALAMPMLGTSNTLAGGLRGAGDTRWVLLIMTGCIWALRLPLAYLLAITFRLGPVGAWSAAVLDINVRGFFLWWRFSKGGWKKIKF